jgi:site-specific recombinase XerD
MVGHNLLIMNENKLIPRWARNNPVLGISRLFRARNKRHTYATRLFENKVDTRVVQAFLGHENIATTTIYTHLTEPTRVSLRKLLDKVMSGF